MKTRCKKRYALVVGGDAPYMESFFKLLRERGFKIKHDAGRGRKSQLRRKLCIPKGITLLIVVTNFGGHNVLNNYKQLANNSGLKVIHCRLSTIELVKKLEEYLCTPQNKDADLTRTSCLA